MEKKSWLERLRLVFWILLLVGLGIIILITLRGQKLILRSPESFQAVFLDNNQVYFGKLRAVNKDLWSLTDVYYLRAGPPLQGESGATERKVELIKLGSELHAPRDEMFISREHVIFYEDMGPQSQIIQLINQHKQGK